LEREWQLTDLATDLTVLQKLQPTLRAGGWEVTGRVHAGQAGHRGLAGIATNASTGSRSILAQRRLLRIFAI